MFTLREPSPSDIASFLQRATHQTFSYPETGSTRGQPPDGYTIDHNRIRLGAGRETFLAAVSAVRAWEMFNLGWVRLVPANAPIEVGTTVALVSHHFGFWSRHPARVLYLIDEERRFGFAYGTLEEHGEQGEERFSVEWSITDDSVTYDILAFSRPARWQTKIANPVVRILQKRFVRDSKAAMLRAVQARP
jgi:uncharacterized protein (UPF0548 family)